MTDPLRAEPTFSIQVECEAAVDLGSTPYGQRRVIPIIGGHVDDEALRAEVLSGGADQQLVRADGVLELEARYLLRSDDGSLISVYNRGIVVSPNLIRTPGPGTPEPQQATDAPTRPYVRTAIQFEAPAEGPHAWLNRSIFLSTVELGAGPATINVRVQVYRVL